MTRPRPAFPAPQPTTVQVALVLLAMPFVRPDVFGESLSVIGFALLGAAAALSVSTGRRDVARTLGDTREPGVPVVVCLTLAYVWLMLQAAGTDPGTSARPAVQGLVLTAGSVLAVLVVAQDPRARLAIGRGFVLVVAGLCGSFVVTVVLWAVAGVGTGVLATIPIGTAGAQPVYFPFTPTVGVQTVLGVEFPRLTGLGREPGWMAMYCAIAYFLADVVALRQRWLKPLLLVGLVGCISTAGFGVFVVVWAYHAFLRDRGTGITPGNYLRQVAGLAAVAGAVWVATAAPVLGLAAKSTQNATSLDERRLATEAGLRALVESPLGGRPTEVQGGINLVSDIAVSGLPFVLMVGAALLLPMLGGGAGRRGGNAVPVIVFTTMLISQPAKDSTWAFVLVALAASLCRPDMEPLVADRRSAGPSTAARPWHRRRADERRPIGGQP